LNYYRRYVGDYLRDTARLSLLEHGAYNLLLDYYYADEQPLPLDKDELYTMVRAMMPGDRKAVDKILGKYFDRQADGYHQKRADHEIEVSKKARTNGKNGGRPGGGNGTGSGTGMETGLVTGIGTETETGEATEHITGEGGGSVHPPTTNHLASSLQPPTTTRQPTPCAPRAAPRTRSKIENREAKGALSWSAYATAYVERWHTEPVRNSRSNALMAQLVDRIGGEEAPLVAAFFVRSSKAAYVSRRHPVAMLVADAEGLRTEWATNRASTSTAAMQADRTAAQGQVWEQLKQEYRDGSH
jgi:uncharacterized protein YdaU (DUF1376 family)